MKTCKSCSQAGCCCWPSLRLTNNATQQTLQQVQKQNRAQMMYTPMITQYEKS